MKRALGTVSLMCLVWSEAGLAASSTDVSKKFAVKPFLLVTPMVIKVSPSAELSAEAEANGEAPPKPVTYDTNSGVTVGASLSYRGVSLAISKVTPPASDSVAAKGRTRGDDYALAWTRKWFRVDAYHKRFKGFHLSNPGAFDPNWASIYPQFAQMRAMATGGGVMVPFSPDSFSLPAFFGQAEVQTKSGGTFLAAATSSVLELSNDEPLVLTQQQDLFHEEGTMRSVEVQQGSVLVGGAYSLVYRGLYGTALLMVGPSYQRVRYDGGGWLADPKNGTATMSVIGIGFDGIDAFGGANFSVQGVSTRFEWVEYQVQRTATELFVGCRL